LAFLEIAQPVQQRRWEWDGGLGVTTYYMRINQPASAIPWDRLVQLWWESTPLRPDFAPVALFRDHSGQPDYKKPPTQDIQAFVDYIR
jgi:hypothetical protein